MAANTSIAAVAFQDGLADSNVSVASYLIGPAWPPTEVKSYHLGNSLTDTVNGYLEPIAASASKNLLFMRKTIPGCAISMNWRNAGPRVRVARCLGRRLQHRLCEEGGSSLPAALPQSAGAEGRRRVRRQVHRRGPQAKPRRAGLALCPWPALGSWHNDAHCTGAGWMQPPWFPPNRKPAAWEEGMANKMAYYLDLKKIWDDGAGQEANPSLSRRPGPGADQAGDRGRQSSRYDGFPRRHLQRRHPSLAAGPIPGVARAFRLHVWRESPGQGDVRQQRPDQGAGRDLPRIAWETVLAEPLTGVRLTP